MKKQMHPVTDILGLEKDCALCSFRLKAVTSVTLPHCFAFGKSPFAKKTLKYGWCEKFQPIGYPCVKK